MSHQCEHENCESTDTDFYYYFMPDPGEPEGAWVCYEHAVDSWCVWCSHWGAGSEDFDFSGHRGYHRECWDELRYETGESDDDEDDDWDEYDGWDYNASWNDPGSSTSDIEPEDTPRQTYIGPGSEYGANEDEVSP